MDIFSITKSALEQTIQDCQDLIQISNEPPSTVSLNQQQERVLKASCLNAKDRLCQMKTKYIDKAIDLIDKQAIAKAYNERLESLQTLINQFQ